MDSKKSNKQKEEQHTNNAIPYYEIHDTTNSSKKLENKQVKPKDLEEKDKEHDIDNKHIIYWYSLIAVGILYLVALVILGFSFYSIFNTGIKDSNWILLTFSLILLSMPITLHFTLINKLYKKNGVDHVLDHPVINSVVSLINTIVSKLNK